jgi:hypothetical protein
VGLESLGLVIRSCALIVNRSVLRVELTCSGSEL